jgi:LysM repeat protein
MADPKSRSPLRILAPLALVVCAVALFFVVAGSGSGGSGEPATDSADTATATTKTTAKKPAPKKKVASTYTVKTGDNLGSIAEKTQVPVDKLQEINPELDPQALVTGQKIKLKE